MPFVDDIDTQQFFPIEARDIFVGRTSEIHFFRKNILKPDAPTHNILSIYGQAGVGKTTLLNHFMLEADAAAMKEHCLVAMVDEKQTDPASMMEQFAAQLHIAGKFKQALEQYKTSLRKLQVKQEMLRETFGRKATTEIASTVVEKIPVIGDALGHGTELIIEQMFDEFHYHQLLKEAERLEDPIDDLTQAFVTELNILASSPGTLTKGRAPLRRRVLLCMDTFEQLASSAAPWLLNYFLKAKLSRNIVLIVAGRTPIERSTPDDPKQWLPYANQQNIHHISLESLNEEETRLYLVERGIQDETKIQTIWQLSHGLPLYLGLWTSNPEGSIDPTADVVANFLRGIPQQEQAKHQLVLKSALLSLPFNQDDLEAFDMINESERPLLYQWLIAQPFVKSDPQDGKHLYHELAQELFSRHLYHISSKECQKARLEILHYYQSLRGPIEESESDAKSRSTKWHELTLAIAEQMFFQPGLMYHISATEHVIDAFGYSNRSKKREIYDFLDTMTKSDRYKQMDVKAQTIIEKLLQYTQTNPPEKDLIASATFLIHKICSISSFTPAILSQIYYRRGLTYRDLKRFDEALADFTQAITLDPSSSWAYHDRGSTYQDMKRFDEALADFTQAIALDPSSSSAYNNRGLIYRDLKRSDEALADFTQAIALDPSSSSAYNSRGLLYRDLKRFDEALADFTQAITLDPSASWAYHYRGLLYRDLKRYDEALADLTQAIALDPSSSSAYNSRGLL